MDERSVGQDRTSRVHEILPLGRLDAFSDGVFAIAITLLVLELSVPGGSEPLVQALIEQWPEFLGYLISFAFIGGIWMSHARMTKLMRHADPVAAGLNLLTLLFVALMPFATAVMVANLGSPEAGVAVLIYGTTLLLTSLMLTLLLHYLVRARALLVDDIAEGTLSTMVRQRWVVIAVNIGAIASTLVLPLLAVGLYLGVALLQLTIPLVLLRRRRPDAPRGPRETEGRR